MILHIFIHYPEPFQDIAKEVWARPKLIILNQKLKNVHDNI
jgi:hypothetical protein